ncbi:MAG: hypothetical protein AB7D28_02945 [Candidatus Berkiella sp.]
MQAVSPTAIFFNKSFATNAVALLCIAASFVISNQASAACLSNIGYFAFSGALTNWLAIYMLFEKIPGLYGSGVIPTQFNQFKAGIKQLMMGEFFDAPHITANPLAALSQTTVTHFKEQIDYEKIYQSLMQEIQNSSIGAMLSMFGGANALDKLKAPLQEKIKIALEKLIEDFQSSNTQMNEGTRLAFRDTVESMIDDRLKELTPQHIKQIIQRMIREHLGWLVVWGGVFGGLIGFMKSFI